MAFPVRRRLHAGGFALGHSWLTACGLGLRSSDAAQPIAMQLPVYADAKAYLNDIDWKLERVEEADRFVYYELRDPQGHFQGQFDNLFEFLAHWMELASSVLSEHAVVQGFIDEYRQAGPAQRLKMLDWFEGWMSCQDKAPYKTWLSQVEKFTPETLPHDWAEKMKIAAPLMLGENCLRIPQALADIDSVAKQRLKTYPERLGVTGMPLIAD